MLGRSFLVVYCIAILLSFLCDTKMFAIVKQAGISSSLLLSLAGNATALGTIFNTVPATSALFPRVAKHSFLGVVMCELNTLFGLGFSWLLINSNLQKGDIRFHNLFLGFSGMIVGLSTYYSSISIGMICAAISVVDGKDSEAFSRLVMLELIPTITGVFGFVVGMYLKFKAEALFKGV